MTAQDIKDGKANWLVPWIGLVFTVATIIYMAGYQASTLADVKARVETLSTVPSDIATLKEKDVSRVREFDGINRRLDAMDSKLDRILQSRSRTDR